jgi:hypothetical protein
MRFQRTRPENRRRVLLTAALVLPATVINVVNAFRDGHRPFAIVGVVVCVLLVVGVGWDLLGPTRSESEQRPLGR